MTCVGHPEVWWNGCGYWPRYIRRPTRERRLAAWAQHGVTWQRESMHSALEVERQNASAKLRLHLAVMYCPTWEREQRHRETITRILRGDFDKL